MVCLEGPGLRDGETLRGSARLLLGGLPPAAGANGLHLPGVEGGAGSGGGEEEGMGMGERIKIRVLQT